MAKYKYNLIINKIDTKEYKQFAYTYSRMPMQVVISPTGFAVIYESGKQKEASEIWASREVEDAVRKSLLAQLIFYGHNIDFENVLIKEASSNEPVILETPNVHNLIPSDVKVDLSPIRDEQFVAQYLMNRVKSDYESGIAALFSYIYAKSKKCEEDKFTYFWRAFNGVYNSMAEKDDYEGNLTKEIKTESDSLKNWLRNRENQSFMVSSLFAKYYRIGDDFSTAERKSRHFFYSLRDKAAKASWNKEAIRSALSMPGNINENLAKVLDLTSYLAPSTPDKMQVEIEGKKLISNSTLHGYLMTELAYHIRCDYFHAAKPILLHTTLTNPEYRALELANALLEDYLDKHIKAEVIAKINMEREKKSSDFDY